MNQIQYTQDKTNVVADGLMPGIDSDKRLAAERLQIHENLRNEWHRLTPAEKQEKLLQMRLDDASNSDSIELRREKSIMADERHQRRLDFLRSRQQLGQSAEEAMKEFEKMMAEAEAVQ